jgi:hypothetical protein
MQTDNNNGYTIGSDNEQRIQVDLSTWTDAEIHRVSEIMFYSSLDTVDLGRDNDGNTLYTDEAHIAHEDMTRHIRQMSDDQLAHAINLMHDTACFTDTWDGDDQEYWNALCAEQSRRRHTAESLPAITPSAEDEMFVPSCENCGRIAKTVTWVSETPHSKMGAFLCLACKSRTTKPPANPTC